MTSPTQKRTRTKSRDKKEIDSLDKTGHVTQFHPDVPQNLIDGNDETLIESEPRVAPETKLLRVGRDMSLRGAEIVDCDHLVVEGKIDGTLVGGSYLKIDESGTFKGSAEVEHADISGVFEGDLQVHSNLMVRPSGLIIGKILYGQLEVERGGRLQGDAQYSDTENKNRPKKPNVAGSKASRIVESDKKK